MPPVTIGAEMNRSLRKKVVAIPLAVTPIGSAVAKLVAAEQGGLALGAPFAAQVKALDASIDRRHGVYSQHVDLDRPKSVSDFFEIIVGQFGHLDVIVIETIKSNARNATAEKIIELSLRRLLHCLDAALPFIEGDLHVINIAPVAVPFGIPVATAFLGAKLATTKLHVAPRLRMSTVSPFDGEPLEDGSLARTILHLMKEQRSPDVMETVLRRPIIEPQRHVKPPHARSKVSMQI
jgi:NADP-dependent 3-hydroxy acid dehydrogenase YdfG